MKNRDVKKRLVTGRQKIILFATSDGSGMGKSLDNLQKICPNASFVEGKLLSNLSDEKTTAWEGDFQVVKCATQKSTFILLLFY